MKNFFNEFKKFISKGNVLDLAVAVVIGNAFNKIVSSLVDDVVMPIVGLLIGGINFKSLTISLPFGASKIAVGSFLQNIVDFLIIAFTIFVVIKAFNKVSKKEAKKEEKPAKKPDDIVLLEEIRDLLKKD